MSLLASTLLAVGKTAAPIGPQVGQRPPRPACSARCWRLAVLALVIGLGWLLSMPGGGFRPAEA